MTTFIDSPAFQGFCERALAVLADSAAKGALLLALAWLIALGLRKSSAAARHLVWALALGGLLLLPALALVLPQWQLPILPSATVPARPERIAPLPAAAPPAQPVTLNPSSVVQFPPPSTLSTPSTPSIPSTPPPQTTPSRPLPPGFWLLAVWLAVAVASLLPLLAGFLFVNRLIRRSEPLAHEPWPALLRSLSEKLGIRRRVRVLRTRGATMPMAVGVWRPTILLPAEAEAWSAEKRQAVLLHELAHIRRGDCAAHILTRLACVMHWFNPLAWLALKKLQNERERACDDLVLAAGARPAVYADQLLDIARTMRAQALASTTAIPMARKSQLEGRLLAILEKQCNRKSLTRKMLFLSIALTTCVVFSIAAMKPVQANQKVRPDVEQIIRDNPQVLKITGPVDQMKFVSERSLTGHVRIIGLNSASEHLIYQASGKQGVAVVTVDLEKGLFGGWTDTIRVTPSLPARMLHFPKEYIRLTPGVIAPLGNIEICDETRDWSKLVGWQKIGLANGDVNIPAGKAAMLTVNTAVVTDLHVLDACGPDDLQAVQFPTTSCVAALPQFARLTGLRMLYLGSSGATDDGLAHLAGLKNLVYLDLQNCPVSDAGLRHLDGLRELKELWLFRTRVTLAGVKALRKKLPGCNIQWEANTDSNGKPQNFEGMKKAGQQTEPSVIKATLPNRVTVELIGLARHPGKNQKWWKPDGSPLAVVPEGAQAEPKQKKTAGREDWDLYELAYRLNRFPGQNEGNLEYSEIEFSQGIESSGHGGSVLPDQNVSMGAVWFAAPPTLKTFDLRLETDCGPPEFQGGAENADSSDDSLDLHSIEMLTPLGSAIFSTPVEIPNGFIINMTNNLRDFNRWNFKYEAIDRNGHVFPLHNHRTDSVNGASLTQLLFTKTDASSNQSVRDGAPFSQVKRIRLTATPRESVEFKNISLRPGELTDVQIKIAKSPVAMMDDALSQITDNPASSRFQLRWVAKDDQHDQAEQLPWFDAMELAPRIWVLKDVLLTDDNIASASLDTLQESPGAAVWLKFKPDAAERFTKLTGENIRRRLAMIIDGKVIGAPTIMDKIPSGQLVIREKNFTREDSEPLFKALGGKVSDRAKSHHVTGKLEFGPTVPDATRKQYVAARLTKRRPQAPGTQMDPDGSVNESVSTIALDGQLDFQDNLKGEYGMTLLNAGWDYLSHPLQLPQPFVLDNLSGDAPLGTALVPGLGKVKVKITLADPAGTRPAQVYCRLDPVGSHFSSVMGGMSGNQTECEVGPVVTGEYDVCIMADVFKVAPEKQRVKIEPGQTVTVQAQLKLLSVIFGVIWEKNEQANQKKAVKPSRVTLRGPGGERVLKQTKLSQNEALEASERGQDLMMDNGFGFMDLPPGTYDLTIEADGYKTFHATRTVTPGKPDAEKNIVMEPVK